MKITLNDLLNAKGVSEPLQGAVKALIDRLEAAESEALEQARLNGMGGERELALMAKLEAAEKERDDLLAALQWMVLRAEEGGYPDGKCLEEARAAIARATGEQL